MLFTCSVLHMAVDVEELYVRLLLLLAAMSAAKSACILSYSWVILMFFLPQRGNTLHQWE